MKKTYQQPQTDAILIELSSILCASAFIDHNAGDNLWGA